MVRFFITPKIPKTNPNLDASIKLIISRFVFHTRTWEHVSCHEYSMYWHKHHIDCKIIDVYVIPKSKGVHMYHHYHVNVTYLVYGYLINISGLSGFDRPSSHIRKNLLPQSTPSDRTRYGLMKYKYYFCLQDFIKYIKYSQLFDDK